jgi:hypothetical protein
MKTGVEIQVGASDRITIDGAIDVVMCVRRIDDVRWTIERDGADSRVFEIRHDPNIPLDAWSVHPANSDETWQTFPSWEAAIRFTSILR